MHGNLLNKQHTYAWACSADTAEKRQGEWMRLRASRIFIYRTVASVVQHKTENGVENMDYGP